MKTEIKPPSTDLKWQMDPSILQGQKSSVDINEPQHNKTQQNDVHPVKTQISLGICPVWSESSPTTWRNLGSLVTHWAYSKDSDQTGWVPRLIWVFSGHTGHIVGFVVMPLKCDVVPLLIRPSVASTKAPLKGTPEMIKKNTTQWGHKHNAWTPLKSKLSWILSYFFLSKKKSVQNNLFLLIKW